MQPAGSQTSRRKASVAVIGLARRYRVARLQERGEVESWDENKLTWNRSEVEQ